MTIFLCGFMGCGKTTIGKALSAELNTEFYDLDDFIVRKEGKSIPAIFSENGESYFRKIEAESIGEISAKGGVIATGGGAMLNPNTAEFARNSGIVIYLDVPFTICYNRIKGDTNRPLVMNNTKEQLFDLYNSRKSVYSHNSTCGVEGDCSVEEVVEQIVGVIRGVAP